MLQSALGDSEEELSSHERATWKLEQIEAERAEARYRELAQARSLGAWWVHVVVGADSDADARRVAAMLCAASDIGLLPYVLRPGDEPAAALDTTLDRERRRAADGSPFIGTSELLTAIARPPERELPGIRVQTLPSFDTTPEPPPGEPLLPPSTTGTTMQRGVLSLGTVLDAFLQPAQALLVSSRTLLRHTFVCGATGSGKSQTRCTLIEGLARADEPVPWLVLEPAKREYAVGMAGRLAGAAAVDQAFLIGAVVIRLFEQLRAEHAAREIAGEPLDDNRPDEEGLILVVGEVLAFEHDVLTQQRREIERVTTFEEAPGAAQA